MFTSERQCHPPSILVAFLKKCNSGSVLQLMLSISFLCFQISIFFVCDVSSFPSPSISTTATSTPIFQRHTELYMPYYHGGPSFNFYHYSYNQPPSSYQMDRHDNIRIGRDFRRNALSATTTPGARSDDGKQQQQQKQQQSYHWTSQNVELAVPALIGMLADPLLSLMDTAYVGRIGAKELAALGACTSIFHLAFNAFRATTTATTSLVGNAQTEEEKREIVQISLSLGVLLGLIVMTILEMAGPWCLKTMGVPRHSSLFAPASAYLGTRLWAAPVVLGIVVAEGAFRGYGDTKIPLLASIAASMINLVLDPILMFPLKMGVRGAAAATALSQVGAAAVYVYFLFKRRMLPQRPKSSNDEVINPSSNVSKGDVIKSIMGANFAMVCKQGSLLLAWAYATARATRIGSAHVAAHQVALSCWLVCALILDGTAVSAQVLMSRSLGVFKKVKSLVAYMFKFAFAQGLATTGLLLATGPILPGIFTTDAFVRHHLHSLMPQLAWQQLLVSLTLVTESLAIGGNQFQLLAAGTTLSTILAMWQLKQATSVVGIWANGLVALFAGRLITALIGVFRVVRAEKVKDKTR